MTHERVLSLDEWAAVALPAFAADALSRGGRDHDEIAVDAFWIADAMLRRSKEVRDGRRQAVADDDGTRRTGGT